MKVTATFNPTRVIAVFKKYYSDIEPKAIYKLSDGYLIYAPEITDGVDFNDPYYFVNNKASNAHAFDMREHQKFFAALKTKPLWESGE